MQRISLAIVVGACVSAGATLVAAFNQYYRTELGVETHGATLVLNFSASALVVFVALAVIAARGGKVAKRRPQQVPSTTAVPEPWSYGPEVEYRYGADGYATAYYRQ